MFKNMMYRVLIVIHFMLTMFEHEDFKTWVLWVIANVLMIAFYSYLLRKGETT